MEFSSWDAGLHTWDSNRLQHFGVAGMKWGQRRYQNEDGSLTPLGEERYGKHGNRSARGRSRDLNKLDREYTQASHKAKFYKEKAEARHSKKLYRALKKDPNAKIDKDEKTLKWESKARAYKKLSNKSRNLSSRIISDTLKKKMSVRSKDTLREVNVGRNLITSIGLSAVLPNTTVITSEYAKGTHYRVKNDGRGQRIHKKTRAGSRTGRNTFMGYSR